MLALLCREPEPLIQERARRSGVLAALFVIVVRNTALAAGVWFPHYYFDADTNPRQSVLVFSVCTVQNAVSNELIPVRFVAILAALVTLASLQWPTKAPINPD